MNIRNKSANSHQFAMVPDKAPPRSVMRAQSRHLMTFDAGYLVPFFLDQDVVPGDTFNLKHTIMCRMSTPQYALMDNVYADTFYFFVPYRLIWDNAKKFFGEQTNPGDSISYLVPQQVSPVGGYAVNSLQDYFGLPTVGQLGAGNTKSHSALPLRAYNLIYNEWFRDQNLQNSIVVDKGDGPDTVSNYVLRRRGKRYDYFTSCLPWPQKGGVGVSIPLVGNAQVKPTAFTPITVDIQSAGNTRSLLTGASGNRVEYNSTSVTTQGIYWPNNTGLFADLTSVSGVLINQLRTSLMIQQFLEIDARGGTRYIEYVRSHFGVVSPDARLQRPEYLGGGSAPVNINPIAQTSGTGATGTTTPLAHVSGVATLVDQAGFANGFTEHGIIIGLISVRADLTYQQGLHRSWTRQTRYDFYDPAFANLGERAVRNDEIYCYGDAADAEAFGYQEAWAEYRYKPSRISGLFRSTAAGTIDGWHLAQKFTSRPALNAAFIEDTPPLARALAVGANANGQQFIADILFDITMARPMPMHSVPGLGARF